MSEPSIHLAQMKRSHTHTAYCQFVFCLATTKFLESCPDTKYLQGHSSTFPHPPGVLQYLTTLTSTQHVPARTVTVNMLDDGTCMLSRPADGSNVQQITRGCSMSKPVTSLHHVSRSSLPIMWKLLLMCHVLPLWHISTHVNFTSSTGRFLSSICNSQRTQIWEICQVSTQFLHEVNCMCYLLVQAHRASHKLFCTTSNSQKKKNSLHDCIYF